MIFAVNSFLYYIFARTNVREAHNKRLRLLARIVHIFRAEQARAKRTEKRRVASAGSVKEKKIFLIVLAFLQA
jgi:mannose/cellobiose epimerase-like protein (N-acyl-D-glucosamine 2-epimerase family)